MKTYIYNILAFIIIIFFVAQAKQISPEGFYIIFGLAIISFIGIVLNIYKMFISVSKT